jgi:hypothetical protein
MWETVAAALHLPKGALWHDMPTRSGHLSAGRTALPPHRLMLYSRRTVQGREMLAPPAGSSPLLRWVQGPLSTVCRLGIPTCKLQAKSRSRVCEHVMPRINQYRTLPPRSGGLQHRHASHGFGPHLPAREGSGAARCKTCAYVDTLHV